MSHSDTAAAYLSGVDLIGRTPSQRLLAELDETGKHIGTRGEWKP